VSGPPARLNHSPTYGRRPWIALKMPANLLLTPNPIVTILLRIRKPKFPPFSRKASEL
jgi:hypothetical protein